MMETRRILIAASAAVLVIAALSGGVLLAERAPWRDDDPIIATVNGEPIRLSEARWRVRSLGAMHEGAAGPLSRSDWPEQVLQSLVDDQLIRQEAARLGIVVTDEDLASAVRDVIDLFPSLEDYQAWLVSQGMDQAEVDRRMHLQVLSARLFEEIAGEVRATPEQLRAYYREHRGAFTTEDGSVATFAEARPEVRRQLEQELRNQAFTAWLEQRRASADVRVLVPDWWKVIMDERSS